MDMQICSAAANLHVSQILVEQSSPERRHPDWALAAPRVRFCVLCSFHGLPERHLRKTDPTGRHCLASSGCCITPSPAHATCYRYQVLQTTELFLQATGTTREVTSVAFQSRLGRDAWLQPATAAELSRLAQAGVRRLLVLCPAFVVDCLETLEEIGLAGRETFLAAGGESFTLIPALNDQPQWVTALREMIEATV